MQQNGGGDLLRSSPSYRTRSFIFVAVVVVVVVVAGLAQQASDS